HEKRKQKHTGHYSSLYVREGDGHDPWRQLGAGQLHDHNQRRQDKDQKGQHRRRKAAQDNPRPSGSEIVPEEPELVVVRGEPVNHR
ncbi:MAG: hypothetical protein HW411_1738, partial [Gammaproteobacteria bacterium]|nr:hypothetical protein [Gammaproteobacteria bacterium]